MRAAASDQICKVVIAAVVEKSLHGWRRRPVRERATINGDAIYWRHQVYRFIGLI